MAREASRAIGGYYPTPSHLIPLIARLVRVPEGEKMMATFLDPCAGDGEAVVQLMHEMSNDDVDLRLYAIELEKKRHAQIAAQARQYGIEADDRNLLHGDAFCAKWENRDGVSVLYLNPPYDIDKVMGRLEERFLSRYTSTLATEGTLFFVVPYYALAASADTLATHYDRLKCFRFPGDDFDIFKQVVLVARRGASLLSPQGALRDVVMDWAKDPNRIPELGSVDSPLWSLPSITRHYQGAFNSWTMQPVDIDLVLSSLRPWQMADRFGKEAPVPGIMPTPGGDLLKRVYPTAMPPRPAHIAAGIAAGVFNGSRVVPNEPGLPPLLVKGAFDKEFRTVDEKTNKQGEVTALVQVQQPKLSVTVLDLSTFRYHTLDSGAIPNGTRNVEEMTTGDLLQFYGKSLLDTLLDHCPVMHDPKREDHILPLPFRIKGQDKPLKEAEHIISRDLFRAQAHAVMASVKLLGGVSAKNKERRGKAAILLGEIGSGKSLTALTTAHSIGARSVLILCPPHLLKSWQDQIAASTPWAKVSVLRTVSDVEAFASGDDEDNEFPWQENTPPMRIAILSREAAKLGHPLKAVSGSCPDCGAALPSVDVAKRRSHCEFQYLHPQNDAARLATELAFCLMRRYPEDGRVSAIAQTPTQRKALQRYSKTKTGPAEDDRLHASPRIKKIIRDVANLITLDDLKLLTSLELLVAGVLDPDLSIEIATRLYTLSLPNSLGYGPGEDLRRAARRMLVMLPLDSPQQQAAAAALKAMLPNLTYSYSSPWAEFDAKLKDIREGGSPRWFSEYEKVKMKDGKLTFSDIPVGDTKLLVAGLGYLQQAGAWRKSKRCGSALYQSVPQPRRVPLATYIAKRHPYLFDFLIADEAHEFAGGDVSAQGIAAQRLMALKMPTLLLTGSIMNGYAESLFMNLWASSPAFREEFDRNSKSSFVTRYGYKKRIVEQRDDDGKVVEYGSMSDRVTERHRDTGQAPGVLPLLLLKHLLPISVTLHKADLALDLPKCRIIPIRVQPTPELAKRHDGLLRALVDQIKRDRFQEELAGKLFGQLAEAPSHLDRATADTGNCPDGAYEARYPESVGGHLVHRVEPMPASTLLPKEAWAVDKIKEELAEGRNVMVFAWHVNLLPRLARIIEEHTGEPVVILNPAKVPTDKREAWINKEVVAKKRRILLTNPVAVKTGLNPLVHFATEIFMQNPAVDPVSTRQAIGRIDRIGQTKETRVFFPTYAGSLQEPLYDLLMRKVAVSISADGLDPGAALIAAGVSSDDHLSGISIGKELWDLLCQREST